MYWFEGQGRYWYFCIPRLHLTNPLLIHMHPRKLTWNLKMMGTPIQKESSSSRGPVFAFFFFSFFCSAVCYLINIETPVVQIYDGTTLPRLRGEPCCVSFQATLLLLVLSASENNNKKKQQQQQQQQQQQEQQLWFSMFFFPPTTFSSAAGLIFFVFCVALRGEFVQMLRRRYASSI